MREFLTPDDICNQVSMTRTLFKGTVLMVEGVTDQRLFNKFVDRDDVRIFPAHSKDNVRAVVNNLSGRRGDSLVIGIMDADLDKAKGRKAVSPLFYTDCRDMETMLIRSDALDGVLAEYADNDLLDRFLRYVPSVRQRILDSSYPIGLLMLVSDEMGLKLSFRDLDFTRFINPRTLSLDLPGMIEFVRRNSIGCRASRADIIAGMKRVSSKIADKWIVARGHDAVAILTIGLKKGFGAHNAWKLTESGVGGALRLAFSESEFAGTDLFKDTSEWAVSENAILWDLSPRRSPRS